MDAMADLIDRWQRVAVAVTARMDQLGMESWSFLAFDIQFGSTEDSDASLALCDEAMTQLDVEDFPDAKKIALVIAEANLDVSVAVVGALTGEFDAADAEELEQKNMDRAAEIEDYLS